MLTDAELSAMRTIAAEALPGTAVVSSVARTSDSGGGDTLAWTASGTVACRLAPISGNEREIGDRISADADYIVTLPGTVSVTTNSRLVIAGGTFNVEAIRDRSWNTTTRVEVVKEV